MLLLLLICLNSYLFIFVAKITSLWITSNDYNFNVHIRLYIKKEPIEVVKHLLILCSTHDSIRLDVWGKNERVLN